VRMPYGPLRWLIVSPEFHHWHHSAEREARDRNYASLVAFWDVLFGTVHLPRGRQPLRYGIDERVPGGCVERFYHPFRRRAGAAGGLSAVSGQLSAVSSQESALSSELSEPAS
jgi:sterol desaturase/sphingolipid hydroxylase (fatty acid hydroxylase superfamily)